MGGAEKIRRTKKEGCLKIRVSLYELKLWKEAAAKEKMSLSKFTRIAINSRTKYIFKKGEIVLKTIETNMNRPRTNKRPRGLIYN